MPAYVGMSGFLCVLLSAFAPAKADALADFYKGRTVTVVVSSSAAGGYDTIARAVARYMAKHMPGNPAFIVRNMPGAGGITATNFLYNNADRDGTVIGLVQNNTPFEPLFGTKEARYDPVKFNWLGTPSSEAALVLLWHSVPVNSLAELKTRAIEGTTTVFPEFPISVLRGTGRFEGATGNGKQTAARVVPLQVGAHLLSYA